MTMNCDHPCKKPTINLPIRGIGLTIDDADLVSREEVEEMIREAVEEVRCRCEVRTRVSEDLHVYVDGKLTEAGNGLSPETAVTSVEEAWAVIGRYDGCNEFNVYLHLADLEADDRYPDINVFGSSMATFKRLYITGNSYQSTRTGSITVNSGAYVFVMEVQARGVFASNSFVALRRIGVSDPVHHAIDASWGGVITFSGGGEINIYPGTYNTIFRSAYNGHIYCGSSDSKLNILGAVTCSNAFAAAYAQGGISLGRGLAITGGSSVSGKKYASDYMAMVKSQVALPGTQNGTATNGGGFYNS